MNNPIDYLSIKLLGMEASARGTLRLLPWF